MNIPTVEEYQKKVRTLRKKGKEQRERRLRKEKEEKERRLEEEHEKFKPRLEGQIYMVLRILPEKLKENMEKGRTKIMVKKIKVYKSTPCTSCWGNYASTEYPSDEYLKWVPKKFEEMFMQRANQYPTLDGYKFSCQYREYYRCGSEYSSSYMRRWLEFYCEIEG